MLVTLRFIRISPPSSLKIEPSRGAAASQQLTEIEIQPIQTTVKKEQRRVNKTV